MDDFMRMFQLGYALALIRALVAKCSQDYGYIIKLLTM